MDDSRENAELQRRLQVMGRRPVAPAMAQRVLARAHAGSVRWLHATRVKVGAALAVGFVAGSMGLASAGELPAAVQEVAHDAFGVVGIEVPPGHDRYNGPECGGTYRNHGQYVRAHKGDPNAGTSPCGKPNKAVVGKEGDAEEPKVEDAGEQGPPPWSNGKAHGNDKDKDTKVKGGKGKGAAGDDEGTETAKSPAPAPVEATTTTAAPITTTTTSVGTTTTSVATTATTTPATMPTTTAPSTTTTSSSTPEAPATTTVP